MFFIASLFAVYPIVAMSGVETPVIFVKHLLEASARGDWTTVLAMLTTDAAFGMGNVGGPLNKDSISTLIALKNMVAVQYLCDKQILGYLIEITCNLLMLNVHARMARYVPNLASTSLPLPISLLGKR